MDAFNTYTNLADILPIQLDDALFYVELAKIYRGISFTD